MKRTGRPRANEELDSMGANNNNNNSYDKDNNNNELRRRPRRPFCEQQQQQVAAAFSQRPVVGGDCQMDLGSQVNELGREEEEEEEEEETRDMVSNNNGGEGQQQQQQVAIISLANSQKPTGRTINSRHPQETAVLNHNHNHHHHQNHPNLHHQQSRAALFVTILLPFVLVFLLPLSPITIKRTTEDDSRQDQHQSAQLDQLILSLLRLPLDRFRLLSPGYPMMMLANAKEISQSLASPPRALDRQANDLQEEETHMLMMAPDQQQPHQSHRQPGGYQLAPARQAPPYAGSGGGEQDAYGGGHDYAATSNSHANLINGNEGAGGEDSALAGAGAEVMPASASGSVLAPSGGSSNNAAQRTDLPSVRALNVKCEKNHMTVNIVFDRPFYGMVFSKGHYNDQKCVHLPPNSGQTSINFDIHLGKCGMSGSSDSPAAVTGSSSGTTNGQQQALQTAASGGGGQQQQPNGMFIENTIIIQYDPQVQEIYDQARRLRCTWYDYYEKSVTFRPYHVDMLDAVTANFLGDNIQCWMQIQVGKGPWSSEVAGIVKIGQTMTMVLAIKDDENKFDMLVRNCVASDGKHQPIQLVDEYGCVARPKIMGKFQKVRNFGPAATVVSYAHFQAFKFPDSMSVHFQCVIQVCRYDCPEPVCSGASGAADQIGTSAAGAGGSGIAAGAGSSGPPVQDYAVSGTELVSSKEPLPVGFSRQSNLSHLRAQQSSVNLKLDESQGPVQVKLDTSMLANTATNGLRAGGGGPPPPHLLHSSQQQLQAADQVSSDGRGHPYLSSSYYRPSLGSATAPSSASPVISAAGPAASRPPLAASHAQMRPNPSAAPPGGHMQYSNPAASLLPPHHHPRPAYMMTNRMGELVAEDGPAGIPKPSAATGDGEEFGSKLSLIATPRALPFAMPTTPLANHRYRRSINATGLNLNKFKRQAPIQGQAGPDSTAIKTQRTIQVVSPDDVAFNLLDLESGSTPDSWSNNNDQRMNLQQQNRKTKTTQYLLTTPDLDGGDDFSATATTMVCFSTGRLITSALASLALLVTLALVAALTILRQRKRLNEKLSPVYDSSLSASSSSSSIIGAAAAAPAATSPADLIINNQSLANHHMQQQQRQRLHQHQAEIILRRQQEEMRQRHTYLGRLYSQFVPAAHWSSGAGR